jgi:hypothetical protein
MNTGMYLALPSGILAIGYIDTNQIERFASRFAIIDDIAGSSNACGGLTVPDGYHPIAEIDNSLARRQVGIFI